MPKKIVKTSKKTKNEVIIDNRTISLSSQDEIIFPKIKITKGDLIEYYRQIASYMIPYIQNRPLTLVRYPEGIKKEGFFQKEAGSYFPSWIKRVAIKNSDGSITRYAICNDAATLVYLTNQRTITYHIWLSTVSKKNYPDRMIFDLDPSPGVLFTTVRWLAKKIKELLESLGLVAYALVTGSKGVHIVVPLKQIHTFSRVHAFAHDVAQLLSSYYPDKATIEVRKNKRGKRIFVDYLRNSLTATAVAPYSVRANEKAGIATPVTWDELLKKGIGPQQYTIKNILKRVTRIKNPWHDMEKNACTLQEAQKKLAELLRKTQQVF